MQPVELKKGIYWVGGVDWNLRYFHGYLTPRGTSYNAYLIVDEKITLVDTVKDYLADEMLSRISAVVNPQDIDYLVVNHVEMDHSGSVPRVMEAAPRAQIVTSAKGKKGLERYHKQEWDCRLVNSGDELSIGKRTLKFVHTPMVHWPDSMVTYIPEEKLLIPNDAFGQHIATSARFDDQVGWDLLREEAGKYYANIVLPYGQQVSKALDVLGGLPIEMIAPSHGIVWRTYLPQLLEEYGKWATNQTEEKALIVYDTMWGSTKKMALALHEGLEKAGLPVTIRFLQTSHISEIMSDLLTARVILIGSPTLNKGMLPTVSALLTYVKGLEPRNRIGFAFGSHGWGGQGVKEVAEAIRSFGWEMPLDGVKIQYNPDMDELEAVREAGLRLGKAALGRPAK